MQVYCSGHCVRLLSILLSLVSLVLTDNSSNIQCPPWLFYNSTIGECQCYVNVKLNVDIHCSSSGALLGLGHCMTYENRKDIVFAKCFYFQLPTNSTVSTSGFFTIPSNASELNDYMCTPMNRKGVVCSECVDGFGVSATSFGYKCTNCSASWSGVLLYIAVEFLPTTVLYLVVLTFRISLTSAPMTCFVFYSQLMLYTLFKDPVILYKLMAESQNEKVKYLLELAGSFYGVWNLDILKYWMPPLCISSTIRIMHVEFLGCVVALYPLLLIFLTWVCVELHDHNFKPVVLIWKPFHRCFVKLRKGYDTKKDTIDVFATFLLLTYSKLTYQSLQVLGSQYLIKNGLQYKKVNLYDPSVDYMSKEHLPFVIVAVLILIVFVIPPPVILLFYPTKVFRTCLDVCKVNGRCGVILHTFVEKFYGCCKDGSGGGYDMRAFSSLYFFLRLVVVIFYRIRTLGLCNHIWFFVIIFFASIAILTAFIKPYKKMYMNIADTLMLGLIALLSLFTSTPFESTLVPALFETTLMLSPMILFVLILFFNFLYKFRQFVLFKKCCKASKCIAKYGSLTRKKTEEHQPLLTPSSISVDKLS